MIDELFKALAAGFNLLGLKEKNKYVDQLTDLKKKWYEEYSKPLSERDDFVLDNIELELRVLNDVFCSAVGRQNASLQS